MHAIPHNLHETLVLVQVTVYSESMEAKAWTLTQVQLQPHAVRPMLMQQQNSAVVVRSPSRRDTAPEDAGVAP